MQQFSIVPNLIRQKGIKFYNENSVEITLISQPQAVQPKPIFEFPYLKIDTFAVKTLKETRITFIELELLKKFGYILVAISATGRAWNFKQKIIYRLDNKSNPAPRTKRFDYLPRLCKIEYDMPNRRIRVSGPNAGLPHIPGGNGGHGPWCPIISEAKSLGKQQ